jgi:hypothetical protein
MAVDVVELLYPIYDGDKVYDKVEIRELTGNEEDILFNVRSKLSYARRLVKAIENCIVKIGDISDREKISQLVNKLTLGNIWYLFIRLRSLTFGDAYAVEVNCPNPTCGQKQKFAINLSELEVKKGSGEQSKKVKLSDGREVELRPEFIGDEHAWVVVEQREDIPSHVILGRVYAIDGKRVGLQDIKALSMKDRMKLRREIENLEGGVDDTVIVTCKVCGEEFEATLNFGSRDFFLPQE